jgi:hypothetical protein
MRRIVSAASVCLIVALGSPADAKTIYVNNRTGNDINDGTSAEVSAQRTGPVRSLERVHALVGPGDRVEIANNGDAYPYYDSLRLIGARCSGAPDHPVLVNGNGAVIDGSEPVDPAGWVALGGGLWRMEMLRKGWYGLVRGAEAVPEVPAPAESAEPTPPPGHWAAWRGAIYYSARPDEIPANEPYRIATRESGLFFYGVHHVVVRDLTVRHFRLDGVNAHDQAYAVMLRNVVSESNGRSGIFVGGSASVAVAGGTARNNREASLLLRELGKADIREAVLDTAPVVAD